MESLLHRFGFRFLFLMLRNYFEEGVAKLSIKKRKAYWLAKPAYVSRYRAAPLKILVDDRFVEVINDEWRVVQSAAAMKSFYVSSEGRYDIVL